MAPKEKQMNKTQKVLLFFFLAVVCAVPLFSEVFLTPRVQADPAKAAVITKSWNEQAAADPSGRMAAFMKKRGESGYIGDIYMDFDDAAQGDSGAVGMWDKSQNRVILHSRLADPYISENIAHEAGGHAWFDTQVPEILWILPPRYAVAMGMIKEIGAFLYQAQESVRQDDYYRIKETITERPRLDGNVVSYFCKLCKYFADVNPGLGEAGAYQAACNEFALGFLSNDYYINHSIGSLPPDLYEMLEGKKLSYSPPVLNRQNSQYIASLDTIMSKYLQTAMPDGVKLTLDIKTFLAEVSRQIDRVDRVRAANGLSTCAQYDALLAQSVKKVEALGSSVRDGDMGIETDAIAWLDALVGKPKQNPQILQALRANSLYKNF